MAVYAGLCGWTLARAHARSGDRIALAAYLGKTDKFDTAIAEFAETYADQNERDHAALAAAVADGPRRSTIGPVEPTTPSTISVTPRVDRTPGGSPGRPRGADRFHTPEDFATALLATPEATRNHQAATI